MSHDNRRNRAILYARVSSAEQVKGYSLDQQIDALRQWALEEGHEVLEEVRDEGVSGAYLERGGLDRVRDLVEEGGISVVVAQDADRITRDPGHRAFLDSECERFGTRLVALDDWGDDTHEGELLRYLKGWMAKGERIKIAERTRRGKLQKARAGKIIGAHTPRFGFRFVRDGRGVPVGYEVDEGQMRIVRMVFSMLGDEGMTLYGARKRLMKDAIPTPSGKKIWHQSYLRRMILDDIYRPHTYSEVCSLVSEEVASTLDASLSYGIFSYDRRSQKKTVDKTKPPKQNGDYRYSYEISEKPRGSWLAIPVPDAGIERALVDRARSQIKDNVRSSKASNRVWEASGGILRCAQCSRAMQTTTVPARGRLYHYYRCPLRVNEGEAGCQNHKNFRAERAEEEVWEKVLALLTKPKLFREGHKRMVERMKRESRSERSERTTLELHAQLEELAKLRAAFQLQQARGLMTLDELDSNLAEIEERKATHERELEKVQITQQKIAAIEASGEATLEALEAYSEKGLRNLTPEERNGLYRRFKVEAVGYPSGSVSVVAVLTQNISIFGLTTGGEP